MFDLKVAKQNGAVVELLEHGRGLKAWFLYFHFNFSRNMWILELWWKRTQESVCKHGAHIVLETTMKISHKWWCRCYHIRRQRYLRMKSSPLHQCLHIYASRKESSLHIYIYIYVIYVVLAEIEDKEVEGLTWMLSIIWVFGNHPIFLKSRSKLVSWRCILQH